MGHDRRREADRAARMAGLPTLVCIEAPKPQSEDEILEDQLVENCLALT